MAQDDPVGTRQPSREAEVHFIIDRQVYSESLARVEARAAAVRPEPVSKHYVLINGRAYPVKQVFGLAFNLPRMAFTTQRAVSALVRLGFEVHEVDEWSGLPIEVGGGEPGGDPLARASDADDDLDVDQRRATMAPTTGIYVTKKIHTWSKDVAAINKVTHEGLVGVLLFLALSDSKLIDQAVTIINRFDLGGSSDMHSKGW